MPRKSRSLTYYLSAYIKTHMTNQSNQLASQTISSNAIRNAPIIVLEPIREIKKQDEEIGVFAKRFFRQV